MSWLPVPLAPWAFGSIAPLALSEALLTAGASQGDAGEGGAAWMSEASFWVALAALVAAVLAAAGIWTLVVHMRQLREQNQSLEVLGELDLKLGRLVSDRDDLDLRRLEHVLIDLREGQVRLEEALLRAIERRGEGTPSTDLARPVSDETVGERVVNRLLSLGYEKVQIVTRSDKLSELLRSDGEILVEARRDGVLCKGRALLRGGRLTDVEMNPGYSIFP